MYTNEEIIEFFGLKWIEDKGVHEFSHGRTENYDYSGWGKKDKVIVKTRYKDEDLLDCPGAEKSLFPLLLEEVMTLKSWEEI